MTHKFVLLSKFEYFFFFNRFIALELCAGTLKQAVKNEYDGPPIPETINVLLDIASGLSYIHSQKIVHRDLKPTNILISLTQPVHMKIADFGLSKRTNARTETSVSGPFNGSLEWAAPELLKLVNIDDFRKACEEAGSNIKLLQLVDVFSSGCVFFYFLTKGQHPFGSTRTPESLETTINNIKDGNPVNFSKGRTIKK